MLRLANKYLVIYGFLLPNLFVFLHFLLSICVIQLLFGVTNSYLALSSAARLWNHIQIQIRSLANCKYEIFQIQIQNAKFGAEVQD